MEQMDVRSFRDPPGEYREVPFWSWNDELDPEELVRQIALMDQAGWGGFFMHARVGLVTPYMGKEWMACVRACVNATRERGMGAWLYDEDKWPSGFAGGLSVAANPAYRDRRLVCKVDDRPALLNERIATFAAREIDGQLTDVRPDDAPAFADDADRVIQFYPQTMPLGMAWFNDYAYLDLLNPEAVRDFLDTTHEAYAGAVGDDFGDVVPGIFTDEPCLLYRSRDVMEQPSIPWTAGFLAYFQARNGYDLLPHLPSLFFDCPPSHPPQREGGLIASPSHPPQREGGLIAPPSHPPQREGGLVDLRRVRYDYWRTITERFVESYSRQVYAWCDEHRLAYTGHYMDEDTLLGQIEWIGAAMPHYAAMHIPGVDKLGRTINGGQGAVLTIKQLDSVACQLGKPRTLCENYGCGGQDFAHTGRKWIGDWAYVLGINLNNPHLSLYSMRGERKRDYPQNIFYQQPWWPENRLIADYFARLSYALSQGQRVVDILVIHPIGSAWTLYRPGASYEVEQLDRALNELLMTLMENQRDVHLGDEMLMGGFPPSGGDEREGTELGASPEASVTTDEVGPRLDVGQMTYRLVIVPPGVTLAENTVRLLQAFAEAGGPVVAMEPVPILINGQPTDGRVLPQTTRMATADTLPGLLDELLPFDVRVPGRPSIWAHHRRVGQADCYFLANIDRESGGVATVELRGEGRLEAWDPATGDVRPLPSRQSDGHTEVVLDFPPVGSQLLVLHRDQAPVAMEPTIGHVGDRRHPVAEILLDDTWQLILGGPNVLTLDTPQLRIGEGDGRHPGLFSPLGGGPGRGPEEGWSDPMHVLDAHEAVAEAGVGAPFALRFVFTADVCPPPPVYLVVESPNRFAITVNGRPVASDDTGWWTDISFQKVDVSPGLLRRPGVRAGRNEIVLKGTFARDTELESVYLLGDFGVVGRRLGRENRFTGQVFDRYGPDVRVTDLPDRVWADEDPDGLSIDLTARGLPFFAGRATLRQTVSVPAVPRRAVLEVHNLRAAVCNVRVNGQSVGTVAWPPHCIEVTSALRGGEGDGRRPNEIEIELVGTLRNLLGPHHRAGGDREWTGPRDFRDKSRWTDDYVLVPFGFDGVTLRLFESELSDR